MRTVINSKYDCVSSTVDTVWLLNCKHWLQSNARSRQSIRLTFISWKINLYKIIYKINLVNEHLRHLRVVEITVVAKRKLHKLVTRKRIHYDYGGSGRSRRQSVFLAPKNFLRHRKSSIALARHTTAYRR